MFIKNYIYLFIVVFSFGFNLKSQNITTYKVKDNLYFVGDRTFSCFYITDKEVIVIDPLDSLRASATLSEIQKITTKPVTKVFYSHNHWDHISGGQIFNQKGTEFIAHIDAKNNITPNPEVIPPTTTWEGNKKIYHLGNGQDIELYFFGLNHGAGMTVFRFVEHNAIFVIDLVVPDRVLYAYLPDASPKDWVETLKEIQKLEFDDVYMSHMRVAGDRRDITFMQEYFDALYKAVQTELDEGTSFFDIPKKVKLPQYEHLQNYEEWLPMNVWHILMEKSIGK